MTVIKLSRELGVASVGTVALDGTKISTNASTRKMMDKMYILWLGKVENELAALTKETDRINEKEEKELKDQRGDEIPKEIRKKQTLRKKILEAIDDLKTVMEAQPEEHQQGPCEKRLISR